MDFHQYDKNGDTPVLIATRNQRLEILQYIIKEIPLIKEDKSVHGDTALMIATFQDDLKTVSWLVEEGKLDVNTRDNQGYTPFIAACANGYLKLVIYFLCMTSVDPEISGYNKQTAMHRAAFYGETKVIQFVHKLRKLSLDQPDKKGNTPFHYAAVESHFSTIRVMLDYLVIFN